MDFWDIASYAAWIIAGGMLLFITLDAFRVSREYDEDLLMSSKEGVDELLKGEKDD
ncbi:hypothetical protein imdm_610 [gamma proteobacterium IMCC2047]|nr:hypothetical protein imdm_610 [gamma proteobacterium IMCC2047]